MPTVSIDGKDYDVETLPDSAKANLVSLKFVQDELKKLQAQIAVYKTAEAGYAKELKLEIDKI